MRILLFFLAVALATPAIAMADTIFGDKDETPVLETTKDKRSYALGMDIGANFKAQGYDLNPELVQKGLADAYAGGETMMTDKERAGVMQEFRQELVRKRMAEQESAAIANKAAGQAFLEANKSKEGVKTTSSGLQYKVIKEGEGESPKAEDTVTVEYRGTLLDGTEFDSSYERGQSATFPLKGVIAGWTEGLQLMKPGAKYMFFIPPELAYGPRQMGPFITPNSTLIFEVELLEVKKQ